MPLHSTNLYLPNMNTRAFAIDGIFCRSVCGRRVRVEHALKTGSKKEYKASVKSHYDHRYASEKLLSSFFVVRYHMCVCVVCVTEVNLI